MTETISTAEYWALQKKAPKYGNKRADTGAYTFASKAEETRWGELQLLESAGLITGLRLQPSYILQPAFRDSTGKRHRAIRYVGDFAYTENGRDVCEDVKGATPAVFLLKEKLFRYRFPHIELRIIPV